MKVSPLRDLTRKFAAGGMDEQAFRSERRALIDGIVAGRIPLEYRDISGKPAGSAKGPNRRKPVLVAGMIGLPVLLVTALLLQLLNAPEPVESPAPVVVAETNPGIEMIREMLKENEWDESGLAEMETTWSSLSAFQRETARRSNWHKRIVDETETRIRDYEMFAADDPENLRRALRLKLFLEKLTATEQNP